jgi:hypothetical protein
LRETRAGWAARGHPPRSTQKYFRLEQRRSSGPSPSGTHFGSAAWGL